LWWSWRPANKLHFQYSALWLEQPQGIALSQSLPQMAEARANNPYRQELEIGPEQRLLLYSGLMNKKQGLELLVEAMQRLADVHLLPQKAGAAELVLPSKLLGICGSGWGLRRGSWWKSATARRRCWGSSTWH
jgi:hypothetical protein